MTAETGTIGYMAPEVLIGLPYDHKCDVYSFRICLWEIYSCSIPYSGLSPHASSAMYKSRRPEIPNTCPSALANIKKQCWEDDPKKRAEIVLMLEVIDTQKKSKGGVDTSKKALIACESLCWPKVVGSLNFLDVATWKKAVVCKLLWCLSKKQDTMWIQWVYIYYEQYGNTSTAGVLGGKEDNKITKNYLSSITETETKTETMGGSHLTDMPHTKLIGVQPVTLVGRVCHG
ncbi:hypothetical protein BC332_29712 [Capsicum chinense]|nr:hypothetical protein BC332_29712 [Capsicum chinense]